MRKEYAEETPASAGFCVLRVVLGLVLAAQAIEKLMQLRELQGELILSGVPRPELIAGLLLALELSGALLLLMGRYLRVAGLAALSDALIAIALIALQHRVLELHGRLETSALMAAAAFFLATRRGEFLQRRTSDESELCQQPDPAMFAPQIFETPEGLVYQSTDGRRSQRRWLPRSAG